jgi:hypothetical protein
MRSVVPLRVSLNITSVERGVFSFGEFLEPVTFAMSAVAEASALLKISEYG